MRDKTCPVCGDDLAIVPWGKGVVWQCMDHGVKEWYFEHGPADLWSGRGLGDLRAGIEEFRPREADFRRR